MQNYLVFLLLFFSSTTFASETENSNKEKVYRPFIKLFCYYRDAKTFNVINISPVDPTYDQFSSIYDEKHFRKINPEECTPFNQLKAGGSAFFVTRDVARTLLTYCENSIYKGYNEQEDLAASNPILEVRIAYYSNIPGGSYLSYVGVKSGYPLIVDEKRIPDHPLVFHYPFVSTMTLTALESPKESIESIDSNSSTNTQDQPNSEIGTFGTWEGWVNDLAKRQVTYAISNSIALRLGRLMMEDSRLQIRDAYTNEVSRQVYVSSVDSDLFFRKLLEKMGVDVQNIISAAGPLQYVLSPILKQLERTTLSFLKDRGFLPMLNSTLEKVVSTIVEQALIAATAAKNMASIELKGKAIRAINNSVELLMKEIQKFRDVPAQKNDEKGVPDKNNANLSTESFQLVCPTQVVSSIPNEIVTSNDALSQGEQHIDAKMVAKRYEAEMRLWIERFMRVTIYKLVEEIIFDSISLVLRNVGAITTLGSYACNAATLATLVVCPPVAPLLAGASVPMNLAAGLSAYDARLGNQNATYIANSLTQRIMTDFGKAIIDKMNLPLPESLRVTDEHRRLVAMTGPNAPTISNYMGQQARSIKDSLINTLRSKVLNKVNTALKDLGTLTTKHEQLTEKTGEGLLAQENNINYSDDKELFQDAKESAELTSFEKFKDFLGIFKKEDIDELFLSSTSLTPSDSSNDVVEESAESGSSGDD